MPTILNGHRSSKFWPSLNAFTRPSNAMARIHLHWHAGPFQSQKWLYNHKCLFVPPFVHLSVRPQNPSTAWNHHPSSLLIHPSSLFLHPSSFFIHPSSSSIILPSFRDFEAFQLVLISWEMMILASIEAKWPFGDW